MRHIWLVCKSFMMGLGAMPVLCCGVIWPLAAGMLWRRSWSIRASKLSPCGGLEINSNMPRLGLLAGQAGLIGTG